MAKYLYVLFPIIVALSSVSAVQARSPVKVDGATTIDLATAKDLFERGVPFVDVRSARFYYDGHISRAAHLHWTGMFTEAALSKVATKDQEVVIYAWHYSDGPWYERASESCKRAVSWGFKKVYYFQEGYPGWKAAGYPSD
jgi:rhodanese-related sulfurtransferase